MGDWWRAAAYRKGDIGGGRWTVNADGHVSMSPSVGHAASLTELIQALRPSDAVEISLSDHRTHPRRHFCRVTQLDFTLSVYRNCSLTIDLSE